MKDLRLEEFLRLKEACKKSDMPRWIKYEMDYLSDIVIKRANENNGSLDGVSLNFPDDFKNYDLFLRFAKIFKASFGIINANHNIYKIFDIGQGFACVVLDKSVRRTIEEANKRYEKKNRRK